MTYERREVVDDDGVVIEDEPDTVVERAPRHVVRERTPESTYIQRSDPVGNTIAASSLIQTIVWAVVVLVLLLIGILVLVHYGII